MLTESSSKLQIDLIYLKTLALTLHPILSLAPLLRSCQYSDVSVIETQDLDCKK